MEKHIPFETIYYNGEPVINTDSSSYVLYELEPNPIKRFFLRIIELFKYGGF